MLSHSSIMIPHTIKGDIRKVEPLIKGDIRKVESLMLELHILN